MRPYEGGLSGEQRAADYLYAKGWVIVARRATERGGELDIVALEGDLLVFVEVKARSEDAPEEALTAKKAARLRRAAQSYLRRMGTPDREFRFDLIAIRGDDLSHVQGVLES